MLRYNNKNITNAKKLRKNMTVWERKLWFEFLKTLPIRFYKQKLIGNFIIDFYCPSKKLAIELDGSQHYNLEDKIYDENRTKYLNLLGITLVRYNNNDVYSNFNAVCEDIFNKIKN